MKLIMDFKFTICPKTIKVVGNINHRKALCIKPNTDFEIDTPCWPIILSGVAVFDLGI